MSDPLSVGIAAAAAGVATWLGWLHWPRPPELEGERWFKLAFATTLRGSVAAGHGDATAWERAVIRFAPYHPAGREPERKVLFPEAVALPGAALPGELELVAALAALPGLPARWARLYDTDPTGRAARLGDPAELGPEYDFARWLPLRPTISETGWDVLAAWGDGRFPAAIRAALPARWIAVQGRGRPGLPSWIPALQRVIPLDIVGWSGLAQTMADLRAQLVAGTGRVILIGEEAGVAAMLRVLVDVPEVRDRLAAVVSLGGVIGGDPADDGPLSPSACTDWLGANFAHHALDTERVRFTPYFSLAWLDRDEDPPGAGGLPIAAQRFPSVRQDRGVVPTVEAVDLGVVPRDPEFPLEVAARALVAVVVAWARSRGG